MPNPSPATDSPAARLSQMLNYNLTQMVYVAAKLRLPDLLAEGVKSVDTLAVTVGAHPGSLHRLLRALARQGVFAEEAPGVFAPTPMSTLLRSDVPDSMRPFALSYGEPW
ncbi:MAG: methyltransferase dimerization domain-containing protein [Candidatus Eisenbacteria bacterium]